MDALFVDVGFGTCNLILTGSGEALVIDAGERTKEPLAALHHFSVTRIRHLIVSHWHVDHVGGATGILRAYSGRIGTIWFPADPAFRATEFWMALVAENEAGRLKFEQVKALMVEGPGPRPIWASTVHDADLRLVSPCFFEFGKGVASGDSNATCGVLLFRVGQRFIVFAGDATLAQWEEVPGRVATPIAADVLAVPHHAGILWPSHWTPTQVGIALDNLYSKIVKPAIAVVSAATRPGQKHPRADVLAALNRAHATIMCTQMTHRCTSDLETARALQRSLPVVAPGRASPLPLTTAAGNPAHVACAGSVVVELLATGATIHQLAPHQAFVNRLPHHPGQRPLCRR